MGFEKMCKAAQPAHCNEHACSIRKIFNILLALARPCLLFGIKPKVSVSDSVEHDSAHHLSE